MSKGYFLERLLDGEMEEDIYKHRSNVSNLRKTSVIGPLPVSLSSGRHNRWSSANLDSLNFDRSPTNLNIQYGATLAPKSTRRKDVFQKIKSKRIFNRYGTTRKFSNFGNFLVF